MIKNIKIKTKLIIAFLLIMTISSIAGISSVFITSNINAEYTYAIKTYGFAQGDVGKLLACLGSLNVSVHDSIGYINEEAQNNSRSAYKTQLAKMDGYFSNVDATIEIDETKQKFDDAKKAWDSYLPLAEELMKAGETTDANVVQQVQERLINELDPMYNQVYDSLAGVMNDKVSHGNDLQKDLNRSTNNSIIMVMVTILIAFLLSVFMGITVSRGIANPIRECAKRLKSLANGDLKSPVPQFDSENEIGILAGATEEIVDGLSKIIEDENYLLSEMAAGNFDVSSTANDRYVGDFTALIKAIRTINSHLSETLRQINDSSEQVFSSSEQVSTAAQNLSQGAAEQAGSIDALASTVEEISKQVSSNAENAKEASDKATFVGQEMETSNQTMKQMTDAMNDISNSSVEIGKIIKTIEDIAFQTNILALNAAVEAARAGAAGKGFAVVADEVRNLANKSQEASKNTAVLIESSVRAVENGTSIANQTAQMLETTVEGARDVVSIVNRISAASAEQSKSVALVTENMDQISSVVQNNSATAEESAAASEELSGQAEMLRDLVGRFKLKDFSKQ